MDKFLKMTVWFLSLAGIFGKSQTPLKRYSYKDSDNYDYNGINPNGQGVSFSVCCFSCVAVDPRRRNDSAQFGPMSCFSLIVMEAPHVR
jgi:hypothetical protein